MAEWHVTRPQAADDDRWLELYRGYATFYETPLPPENSRRVWGWLQDDDHECHGLLAREPSGYAVGFAHYRPFPRPLRASTGCYLDDLFVDPAYRGSCAANLLLGELKRIARDNGWDVVRWITADNNYRARGKYDTVAARTQWITYDMPVS